MKNELNIDKIKNLNPGTKLKKLKELKEKKKKEIEKIEELIKNVMDNLKNNNEVDKKDNIQRLAIQEENIGIRTRILEEEDNLEEKVEGENNKGANNEIQNNIDYTKASNQTENNIDYRRLMNEFAQSPTEEITKRLENIYEDVIQRGYVNPMEAREAYIANKVARIREEEIKRGIYERPDENIMKMLNVAKMISTWIKNQYIK